MVDTITPVVHEGRRGKWLVSVVLHTLGATAAAAFIGLILGTIGLVLDNTVDAEIRVAIIGVLALVYCAREAFKLPIPIPDRHKQVPEWWRTFFSPPVAAFLYGVGLGVGFFTYLLFGTFVVVSAAALL